MRQVSPPTPESQDPQEKTWIATYSLMDTKGSPGGSVVKNPPANAGGMGSIPDRRKISRAVKQLSPCTTATEPVL